MWQLPLDSVRILDLGIRIAAPFAATLPGAFGAEVIGVERHCGMRSRGW